MKKDKEFFTNRTFLLCLAFCLLSLNLAKGIGNKHPNYASVSEPLLLNGDFEIATETSPPQFWEVKNKKLVEFILAKRQKIQKEHALHLKLRKRSNLEKTFLLFQSINLAKVRGKSVSFGGQVKTPQATVYLRLWSPEGHSQIEVKSSNDYLKVRKEFIVPPNASVVLFAVEIVGEQSDEIWLDKLYVGQPAGTKKAENVISEDQLNVITIDPSKRLGEISPLKFGGHLEWINAGHKLWDVKTASLDNRLVDQLKQLHIPIWRFPGGIYSDYYNWRDGTGNLSKRPEGIDPFDQKTKHRHYFGTDEFIEFLRNTESQALITANYGTGSLQMAVSWLKYFKAKGIKVRYWEIGNEVYMADPKDSKAANGARIFHTATQYTNDFSRWADALKTVDPDVMVGAIGGINNTHASNREWMDTLLKGAGDKIDFLALHNAFAPVIFGKFDYKSQKNRLKAYRAMLAQVEDVKADIALVKKKLHQYLPNRSETMPIAITEHFPIFGDFDARDRKQLLQNIDQSRTMAASLYTATILTAIINDPQIFMANYLNPVHRYYGSLLNESDEGISKNPVYYVFYMYRNYFGDEAIFSKFEGATFSVGAMGMVPSTRNAPLLEVAASRRDDETIMVAVVNKDMENQQSAKIHLLGAGNVIAGKIYTLRSLWPNAVTAPPLSKSTKRQKEIKIEQQDIEMTEELVIVLPPHSFNILELRISKIE